MLIRARVHPFPSRTRKLSSLLLTILGWRRPGKIGSANTKPTTFVVGFAFVSTPLSAAGLYLNYALGGGLYLNYAHLQIHLLHAGFPDKGEYALANGVAAPQPHQALFRLMPNSAR